MKSVVDPRDAFDAALVPGMRDRLAEAYARFRVEESRTVAVNAPHANAEKEARYISRDCPACAARSEDAATVLRAHRLDLLECASCGLTYTRQVLDERTDAARYAESALDDEAMRLRMSAPYLELETMRSRYYLDRLAEDGFGAGALLEIGCGAGTFLLESQRLGWRAIGIEPGRVAAKIAVGRGAPVVCGLFPQDLPPDAQSFDAVVMLDVLEHFADPLLFLMDVRARLAQQGRIAIQVPNWDSLLVRLDGARSSVVCPGHWSYFTPKTLTDVLARAGFRPLSLETVVSEIDRIEAYPPETVSAEMRGLRPDAPERALDVATLHSLQLGYKLFGVFALS